MAIETALDRVKRILELIPYLHGRSEKVSDLAGDFEVPVEIINRDLEIAFMSGLPGYTPDLLIELTLDSETVSVREPQSLDLPPAMDVDQIVTLFLGIKALLSLMDLSIQSREIAEKLLGRLEDLLKGDFQSKVEMEVSEEEKLIAAAIYKGESISFDYLGFTDLKVTSRRVKPTEMYWRSGQALMRAYDFEVDATRNFFLKRISNLVIGQSDSTSVEKITDSSPDPIRIDLVLESEAFWWTKRYAAFITEMRFDKGERQIVLTVEFWDERWLIRSLSSISDLIISIKGMTGLTTKMRQYLEIAL